MIRRICSHGGKGEWSIDLLITSESDHSRILGSATYNNESDDNSDGDSEGEDGSLLVFPLMVDGQ